MFASDYATAVLKGAVVAVPVWAILFLFRVSVEAVRGNLDPNPFGWPMWAAGAVFIAITGYCLICGYLLGSL